MGKSSEKKTGICLRVKKMEKDKDMKDEELEEKRKKDGRQKFKR